MNRDLIGNVNRTQAAQAAMRVIDALQDVEQGAQMAGLAATFKLAAERAGIKPADLLTYAGNVMHDAEGRRPEFQAAAAYMEGEWKR